jgi:hypothetical protein
MRLSAPKHFIWLFSVILAILSIVSIYVTIPFVSLHHYWVMAAAWLLLALATKFKGL